MFSICSGTSINLSFFAFDSFLIVPSTFNAKLLLPTFLSNTRLRGFLFVKSNRLRCIASSKFITFKMVLLIIAQCKKIECLSYLNLIRPSLIIILLLLSRTCLLYRKFLMIFLPSRVRHLIFLRVGVDPKFKEACYKWHQHPG